MSTLVIVESPAKAKTISKFLGKKFIVKSSFGHVRDLPKSQMGVDIDNNFEPRYIVSKEKSKVVKELKTAAEKSQNILFASDEDREGEAISWHLAQILKIPEDKAQRITFHEITEQAITEALQNPRGIDLKMVDSQQARRILDRLVGYELSPFLWRKVAKGLSAGRVQSVAVRLVIEREREIQNFKPEEYWTIEGMFSPANDPKEIFAGKIVSWQEKKLDKLDIKNKQQVEEILSELHDAKYFVSDVEDKKTKRNPLPPFTTSTLQQEANNRLGFSAKQTMRIAQQLYEGVELGAEGSVGLITYMRTDAVNLSNKFISDAQSVIEQEFGKKYLSETIRRFKNKNKNAQEAHEAVRPTEARRTPEKIKNHLDRNQLRLYELIWQRAIATQMASAEISNTAINIDTDKKCQFRATGQVLVFEGFLKLYPDRTKENILPKVKQGDGLNCLELKPEQHSTEPPARYSDATLVKALEEHNIGRPSTYAPTIATIEDRGYVERDEKKRLKPKDMAFLVNDLLVEHFPKIVDLEFTAQMEEDLDSIARGEKKWQPVIADFYHPFKENLTKKDKELNKKDITEEKTDEICDKCGKFMIIKTGRYGKFMACSGYPECKNTKKINNGNEEQEKNNKTFIPETTGEKCEKCGSDMVKRVGKYGPFIACSSYPKCKNIKNVEVKLNIKCPSCKEGDITERRSKRGKIFYGCNRYPKCDFALWDKPTGEFCPSCKDGLLTWGAKGKIKCSQKDCGYEKTQE